MTGTKVTTETTKRVKVRLNIRLWKETKERLKVAAEKLGVSETDIMEMALRMWFIKEKIS